MSGQNNKHSFWTSLGGILTGVATLITAIVAVYQITKDPVIDDDPVTHVPKEEPTPNKPSENKKESRCEDSWSYDENLMTCIKQIDIPSKSFSIPVNTIINQLAGSIYIYLNRQRLEDKDGIAQYNEDLNGKIQVVIPIMKGSTMVGVQKEIVYATDLGKICSIPVLPETTGHLKNMRVAYELRLDTDCNKSNSYCNARIVESGRRVSVVLKQLPVIIGENCSGQPS